MNYLLLIEREEHHVFPTIAPGHDNVGYVADNQKDTHQYEEAGGDAPQSLEGVAIFAADDQYIEQPYNTEADAQHLVDIYQDAGYQLRYRVVVQRDYYRL